MVNRDIFTGEIVLDKHEKLTFGKYSGKTIPTVLILDPQYLLFLIKENPYCNISDSWKQYILETVEDRSNKVYAGSYNTAFYKANIRKPIL